MNSPEPAVATAFRQSEAVLSKDELAGIGSVAAESTYLENAIEAMIWMLAGIDENTGTIITGNLMLMNRIDLLGKLGNYRLSDEGHKEHLKSLLTRMREAAKERNYIVHGEWTKNGYITLGDMFRGTYDEPAMARRANNSSALPFPAAKIPSTVEKLATLRGELIQFFAHAFPESFGSRN
jgi:hypothetical protein